MTHTISYRTQSLLTVFCVSIMIPSYCADQNSTKPTELLIPRHGSFNSAEQSDTSPFYRRIPSSPRNTNIELGDGPGQAARKRRELIDHQSSTQQLSEKISDLPYEQQRFILDPLVKDLGITIQPTIAQQSSRLERAGEFMKENGGHVVSEIAGIIGFLASIDRMYDFLPDTFEDTDSWINTVLYPTFLAGQMYQFGRHHYKVYAFKKQLAQVERHYQAFKQRMADEQKETHAIDTSNSSQYSASTVNPENPSNQSMQ